MTRIDVINFVRWKLFVSFCRIKASVVMRSVTIDIRDLHLLVIVPSNSLISARMKVLGKRSIFADDSIMSVALEP